MYSYILYYSLIWNFLIDLKGFQMSTEDCPHFDCSRLQVIEALASVTIDETASASGFAFLFSTRFTSSTILQHHHCLYPNRKLRLIEPLNIALSVTPR